MKSLILFILLSLLAIALIVFIAKDYLFDSKNGDKFRGDECRKQTDLSKQGQNSNESDDVERGEKGKAGKSNKLKPPVRKGQESQEPMELPMHPSAKPPSTSVKEVHKPTGLPTNPPVQENTSSTGLGPDAIPSPQSRVSGDKILPESQKHVPLSDPADYIPNNQHEIPKEDVTEVPTSYRNDINEVERVEPAEASKKILEQAAKTVSEIVGIENQNLSCYANAVFQCINSVYHLRDYFHKYSGSGIVTSSIQTIIDQLNTAQTGPLDIHESLKRILSEINKHYTSMSIDGKNDIVMFYLAIISCCILEDYQMTAHNIIFYDCNLGEKILNKSKKNLMDFLVLNLVARDPSLGFAHWFRPYVGIECEDGGDIAGRVKAESDLYVGPVQGNMVLTVIIANLDRKDTHHAVPFTVTFMGKTYRLRSFIVGGSYKSNNGHFYAHVLKGTELYTVNDKSVSHEEYKDTKKYANVRFVFYEAQEN